MLCELCVLCDRCRALAEQWLRELVGEGGCNLLSALRVALGLSPLDTICVVLQTL